MSFNAKIFYCHQCKKILPSLEDLYFVEESSQRGFCSEACIQKFYGHLIGYFEEVEIELRRTLKIEDEDCLSFFDDSKYLTKSLQHPDEIWRVKNELSDCYYSMIAHFDSKKDGKFSVVNVCFLYDGAPSFVFLVTATSNEKFLEHFRWGEKLEVNVSSLSKGSSTQSGAQSIEIDQETMDFLEGKKSRALAELLEKRSELDISLENFALYERFFNETMDAPDEIYESIDGEGDSLFTYIKAHDLDGTSFYYIVTSIRLEKYSASGEQTIFPILAFPTLDGELYKRYRKGELVSGNLKN